MYCEQKNTWYFCCPVKSNFFIEKLFGNTYGVIFALGDVWIFLIQLYRTENKNPRC